MGMKWAIFHTKFKTLLGLLPREKWLMEKITLFNIVGLKSNNTFLRFIYLFEVGWGRGRES